MPINHSVVDQGVIEETLEKLGYKESKPETFKSKCNYINSNGGYYFYSINPRYNNSTDTEVLIHSFSPKVFCEMASIKVGIIDMFELADKCNKIFKEKENTKKRLIGYKLINNVPFSNLIIGDEFRILDGWLYDYDPKTNKIGFKRNLKTDEIQSKFTHLFEEIYEEVPLEITHVIVQKGTGEDQSFDVKIKKEGIYFDDKSLVKIEDLEEVLESILLLKNLKYSFVGIVPFDDKWRVSCNLIRIGCKHDIPVQTLKNIVDIYNKNFK